MAERAKLRFDQHSLFFDQEGHRLHNRTTLGNGGTKIVPTAPYYETPIKPRGRPRKHPIAPAPITPSPKQTVASVASVPPEPVEPEMDSNENFSTEENLTPLDLDSQKKTDVCEPPYIEKDSYGIQQINLYDEERDVAQCGGSKTRNLGTKVPRPLQKKAFAIIPRLVECHWDNCKVTFTRPTAYRYALDALVAGHEEDRIIACYSDALFICHGFAVDKAASSGVITFFNLSSTVSKARKLLEKDGLTRDQRVAQWYRKHSAPQPPFQADIARLREQIAASLGLSPK